MRMYVWKHPDFTIVAHGDHMEQAREKAREEIDNACPLDTREDALRFIALSRPMVWFRENAEFTESMNKQSHYWANEVDRLMDICRRHGIDTSIKEKQG